MMFTHSRWDMRLTDQAMLLHLATLKTPTNMYDMAEQLGCHWRTVQTSINRLAARQYLTIEGSGRGKPYTYKINVDALPSDIKAELPDE
jgi:Mn-dependent DtxR family transcriptional regulator